MTEAADLSVIRKRMAVAMQAMGHVVKDQTVEIPGKYSYNFANLNSVMAVIKPALHDQNLMLTQPIVTRDGMTVVTTMLTALDTGDYIMFDGPGFPVKADPQAAGSAITYYRRYALVTLFALEADDDDGGMAHRAVAQPGRRTPAEEQVVKIISDLPNRAQRDQFKADFKARFGCGLSELGESLHGEALTWAKLWDMPNDAETDEDTNTDGSR